MGRSYTHFCACGKALDSRLKALGASRLAPRADVNREDWAAIDAWIGSALASLPGLGLKPASETAGLQGPETYAFNRQACAAGS